ncbi:hypothetical protein [Niastella sp. OAS944]|uniref:hypothetical protein n=1 Tax=Niastella sp. OAS944 TaxID=2664089 RepID=UPI00347D3E0A|nr:hypothetical protein [Chitinophagaceae bacterium OAS944]
MEINPWPVLFSYSVIFTITTVVCMLLLTLLNDLNMFRIRSRSGYILWGLAVGLIVTFIFVSFTFKSKRIANGSIVVPSVSANK